MNPPMERAAHWSREWCFLAMGWMCVIFVGMHSSKAHAANEEGVFVSAHSVLLGGAARSVVSDGGATWLNPARLTEIDRLSVMANVNALRLSHQRIPNAIAVNGGERVDLGQTNVNILPGSMSLGKQLSDRFTLGLGVFVTRAQVGSESIQLSSHSPNESYDLVIGVNHRNQDYNAVVGLGWQATERSSYGISFVFRYGRQAYTLANWNHLRDNVQQEMVGRTLQQQLTRAGMGVIIGGAWKLRDDVTLTAVLQPPTLMIVDIEKSLGVQAEAGQAEDAWLDFEVNNINRLSADARPMGSARLHMGVAWDAEKVLVSGELEMRLEPEVSGRGYVPVWNGRFGLQGQLTDHLTLGGGVFTDLTQRLAVREFYDQNVQYFGASMGLRTTRVIHLEGGERARTIERSTVFGVRYMMGVGQFGGVTIDFNDAKSYVGTLRHLAHELSLYLGAEFLF